MLLHITARFKDIEASEEGNAEAIKPVGRPGTGALPAIPAVAGLAMTGENGAGSISDGASVHGLSKGRKGFKGKETAGVVPFGAAALNALPNPQNPRIWPGKNVDET